MENNHKAPEAAQMNKLFTENWFSQEFSLVTGLYHLTYDGQWHCNHASENCFKILKCTCMDFLENLQKLVALTDYNDPGKTVEALLHEITITLEPASFISIRPTENGGFQYIKGTLAVSHSQGSPLSIYGQITDVSGEQQENVHLQGMEEEYLSSLQMSGRVIYRYQIKGRRGIIPPEIAKHRNIPENIDNLPEWNVECGRIAPQSADAWLGVFDAIDRGEKHGSAEVLFSVRNGEILRLVQVEFISISDETGTPVSAIISHRDITDESEQRYQQELNRAGLLQIAQTAFPEIIAVNLTRGTYRMIQYYGVTTLGTPLEGPLEQMLSLRLQNVAPEEQQAFQDAFFPKGLFRAIQEDREQIQLTYRRCGTDGIWHWTETIVMRQENPYGSDILMFAVSRNVDRQKAQEELLRQALADSTEKLEDWLYYNNLSKQSFPGLIYVNYADGRPSPYTVGRLAEKLYCSPKELALSISSRIPESDRDAAQLTYECSRESGKSSFYTEYRVETTAEEYAWIYNYAVSFKDKEGNTGYIHFLTDTTREHALAEQVRLHMEERLKENEHIFQIVSQHSNRILYSFDLITGTTQPWNTESRRKDVLAHMYTGSYRDNALDFNEFVLPDCRTDVKQFFHDIYHGIPSGEVNVHIRLLDEQLRWYHFKYSSIFDNGRPVTALISIEDITEEYELKVSHMRLNQSLDMEAEHHLSYVEADLTDDRVEKFTGVGIWNGISATDQTYSTFLENYYFGLTTQDCINAHAFYSRENLLSQYKQGSRHLENLWLTKKENHDSWVMIKTDLIVDPLSRHIKMFSRMLDVTAEQEELIAISKRADYDAMTGLLQKGVGEQQIQTLLASNHKTAGTLIVLDLDDLKGINDTLGHKQGDAAIIGISQTLAEHFGEDGIILRAGGDEFIVYLPGTGQDTSSTRCSMTALLRKLSSIAIGENGERHIHCSAGCAVEIPGTDTYDSLFKRADTALYHVKRSSKNNFAFYEPEMSQADYQFRSKKLLSLQDTGKFDLTELQYLLSSIATFYQLILSVNLSTNTYYMMEEVKDGVFSQIPAFGVLDDFIQLSARPVHPEDIDGFLGHLSREVLLQAYEQGKQNVQHHFRFYNQNEYQWIECVVIFYKNDQGDVCDFTMLHWINAPN